MLNPRLYLKTQKNRNRLILSLILMRSHHIECLWIQWYPLASKLCKICLNLCFKHWKYASSIQNMPQAFLKEKKEKKRKEAKEKKRKKRKILFVFQMNFEFNINHLLRWLKSCLCILFRTHQFLISCTYAKKTICRKIISRSQSWIG